MIAPRPTRLLPTLLGPLTLGLVTLALAACGSGADAQAHVDQARSEAAEAQSAFVELQVGLPDGLIPGDESTALGHLARAESALAEQQADQAAEHFRAARSEYARLIEGLTADLVRRLGQVRGQFEADLSAFEAEGRGATQPLPREELERLASAQAAAEAAAAEDRHVAALARYAEAGQLLSRARTAQGNHLRMVEVETKALVFKARLEAALSEAGLTPTEGRIPAALAGFGDGLAAKERGDLVGAAGAFGLAAEDFEDLVGDLAEVQEHRAAALEARAAVEGQPGERTSGAEAALERLAQAEAARAAGLLAQAVAGYEEARAGLLAALDDRR